MSQLSPLQLVLREQAQNEARLANKKRYRRVIGVGLGAAGVAVALVGMDWTVSAGLWGLGAASWAILKAV